MRYLHPDKLARLDTTFKKRNKRVAQRKIKSRPASRQSLLDGLTKRYLGS